MKVGDFTNRVFIKQLFKARLKTRQIIGREFAEQAAVVARCVHRHVHFLRLQRITGAEVVHGLEDVVTQARQALVFGFNGFLQPVAHFAFAVVTGLHRQNMLAQRVSLQFGHAFCTRKPGRIEQQGLGQLAQVLAAAYFLGSGGAFVTQGVQGAFGFGLISFECKQLFAELAHQV